MSSSLLNSISLGASYFKIDKAFINLKENQILHEGTSSCSFVDSFSLFFSAVSTFIFS